MVGSAGPPEKQWTRSVGHALGLENGESLLPGLPV